MRGKKGVLHAEAADPPRRRANHFHGRGTWDHDRPPVFGIVGRTGHQVHLVVTHHTTTAELQPLVLAASGPGSTIASDDCLAYRSLSRQDRRHVTVNHNAHPPEYARDDDGDGIREVHNNTSEGIWTGLRNFLRTFRGVSKIYLQQYVAIFEWSHNLKAITPRFLRVLLGVSTMEGS